MNGAVQVDAVETMSAARSDDEAVDVIVAGAGVVGVATAYALARRGLSVALVDRNPGPALGASYANGAQLSYAYSDALGSPSLLRKLPSLALGADPLFRVKAGFDAGLVSWGLKFLAASTKDQFEAGTLATLQLGLESQQAMHALLDRHPLDFGHAVAGKMHLYFDADALASAGKLVDLKRRHGAVQQVLTAAEAIAVEPALAGSKGLVGVVYSPEDEVGDPHRFSEQLLAVLRRDYGVRTVFNLDVQDAAFTAEGVTLSGPRGAQVRGRALAVALGVEAPQFLARLGIRPPILPMKGYSFTAPAGAAAPRVSLTDTARKLVFCQLSGQIRVAGVAELGERDLRLRQERLTALVASARESLPEAADYSQLVGRWAGLRPMTPSSVPIITRPHARLVLNVGHGMLGWTLAMGSAERAAELLLRAD
jgi:D-amino-acid dehydrogenase